MQIPNHSSTSTTQSGTIGTLYHIAYDAYGNILSVVDAVNVAITDTANLTTVAYAGYRYDQATQTYATIHRIYDPKTGTWSIPDPIRLLAGQSNFYVYCGNDPINGTDPSGWEEKSLRTRAFQAIDSWSVGPSPAVNTGYSILDVPGAFVTNLFGNVIAKPVMWVGTNWRNDTELDRINAIEARQKVIVQSDQMGTGQAFLNLYAGSTTDQIAIGAVGFDPYSNRALGASDRVQRVANGTAGYVGTWIPLAKAVSPASIGATPRSSGGFSGHKGFELQNHAGQPVRNVGTTIGERNFSGHALDQMQNRGIPPSVVDNAIRNGTPFPGNAPGTQGFFDSVNKVRVITNSDTGRVITVIPGGD